MGMRPDPRQDHDRDAQGRIIYLGDVRRRRTVRRIAPDRHYLGAVALIALAAWAVWLTVFFTLAPVRLLTYIAFFLPLGVALAASGTLVAYAAEARVTGFPSLARAARRGALGSAVLVANLGFLAGHRWTPIAGVAALALAVGVDLAANRLANGA